MVNGQWSAMMFVLALASSSRHSAMPRIGTGAELDRIAGSTLGWVALLALFAAHPLVFLFGACMVHMLQFADYYSLTTNDE